MAGVEAKLFDGDRVVSRLFTLGLIINPYAGIGGALGLKGSDGAVIRQQALDAGAPLLAGEKAARALRVLTQQKERIRIVTASGTMGAELAQHLEFDTQVVYQSTQAQTESADTIAAVEAIVASKPDLVLFVGGDGTARDVYSVVQQSIPVLGVPAGCKIHSGVYAVTPAAAGKVVELMVSGQLVSVVEAEVRDLDEDAFRQGKVKAKHFGMMQVPIELNYVQSVKMGGVEQEELVLNDMADYVIEQIEHDMAVMGSGSTVNFIMEQMGLENTLLGVDVLCDAQLIAKDVSASQLLALVQTKPSKLVVTIIGGQGHLLGRGNQQLSPDVIRAIGLQNILVVATKAKLASLNGRPIIVDSGDEDLDKTLCGYRKVITGYNDWVLYPVSSPGLA